MKPIYIVGTADTKGDELAYLKASVGQAGGVGVLVDVGTRAHARPVGITAEDVARWHPAGPRAVLGGDDRGGAVAAMGEAFVRFIGSRDDIAGVLGIGGGGGTSIVT